MTLDTIAIIASIVVSIAGAGIALTAVIIRAQHATHRDIGEVRCDVADLRERMARLEGLFERFTRREPAAPGTGTA